MSHRRRAIARPRPRRDVGVAAPSSADGLGDIARTRAARRRRRCPGRRRGRSEPVASARDRQGRRRGMLDGVAHEVAADGQQRLRVEQQRPAPPSTAMTMRSAEDVARSAIAVADGANAARATRQAPARRLRPRWTTSVDSRRVDDLVDRCHDPFEAQPLRGRRSSISMADQFGVGTDRRQRRADLVIEVGSEFALASHRVVDAVAKPVEGLHQVAGFVER